MCRVVVVGSIHMDFFINVEKLPIPGETVLGRNFTMSPGGKGANQAIGVARLGAETFMVGRVGSDIFADKLIENFRRNNVDTTYILKDPTTHTGIAFILLDEKGENMIAVAPGADAKVSKDDVDRAMDIIGKADILLLQLEIPVETVVYAAKRAWECGVKVILNPAPARTLPDEIYKYIYTLTPNQIECSMLSNVEIKSLNDVEKASKKLISKGVKNVIVTLGAKGAYVLTEDGEGKVIPAFKVKVVDTTGAGDAFNAALAVSLAEGLNIEEAIVRANAAAALAITKIGAQSGLPSRLELEDFIKKK